MEDWRTCATTRLKNVMRTLCPAPSAPDTAVEEEDDEEEDEEAVG
jgi:hypothetical protein